MSGEHALLLKNRLSFLSMGPGHLSGTTVTLQQQICQPTMRKKEFNNTTGTYPILSNAQIFLP
jgi:hypothetical protein